ncbi:hypothetical protein SAMN04488118_11311 [Epibacterium ulvae]|uniref:Uncharacterized protein n=1 Tax=Epibacterium ulvae TaxID=1156985 RepID=A0A1G5RCX2_9RHOB|nr:hypothetical protein SAMN04488118_11311 [Epibacterium ulvae]
MREKDNVSKVDERLVPPSPPWRGTNGPGAKLVTDRSGFATSH